MKYALEKIIDVSRVREITHTFFLTTGIPAALYDCSGKELIPCGQHPLCQEFHQRAGEVNAACQAHHARLLAEACARQAFSHWTCPNGFVEASAPVIVRGEHVASVFLGQVLLETPTPETFAERAQAAGFAIEPYLQALAQVPVVPLERIEHQLELLATFVSTLAESGLEAIRQAEGAQALQESEARFQMLANAVFEGVALHENGVFLDVNQRFAEMFGEARETFIGQPVMDVIAPESREVASAHIRSQALEPYELTGIRKDGTRVDLEARFQMVPYRGRLVRVAAVRDITERKQFETSLRTSEESLRAILDATPMGIHLYHIEADGTLIFDGANPAAQKILGLDHGPLVGLPIEKAFPGLVNTEVPERYRQICRGAPPWHNEDVNYKDDQIIGAFDVYAFSIMPGKTAVMFQDILERKRMEKALKDSEEHFRIIYEQAPVAYQSLNSEGRILEVNRAWQETLGYRREEALGTWFGEYLVEEDQTLFERRFPIFMRTGEAHDIDFKMRGKDGRVLDVLFEGRVDRDPNGRFLRTHCVMRDITAIRRAEKALRESEQNYRLLAENVSDVIWRLDLNSMRWLYISPSVERLRGFTMEEAMQQKLFDTIDAESRAKIQRELPMRLAAFEAGNETHRWQVDLIRQNTKDGRWLDLEINTTLIANENGTPVEILGISRDVTARQHAAGVLRQLAQRLEILHDIDRGILAEQPIREICRAALNRLAWLVPCKQVSVLVLSPGSERAELIVGRLNDENEQRDLAFEFRFIQPPQLPARVYWSEDGLAPNEDEALDLGALELEGWASLIVLPLVAGGQAYGAFGLGAGQAGELTDEALEVVTELGGELAVAVQQAHLRAQVANHAADLEKRVAERTAQLQAANRELETFAYSVSHDLKAPLRGIDGYSRLLVEEFEPQLNADARMYLNNVRRATRQMGQLIDDLLSYSRLERRTMQMGGIHLAQILAEVLAERADEIASRGVTVAQKLECEVVVAEAEGLQQVLRNLVDNALKFTRDCPAAVIEIGSADRGAHGLVWVRDNGIGFDMAYHDRIFQIFQRLHRQEEFSGTGIGLAIVAKAMQRMGGRVWAESTPGQGATFYLEIPKR